MEPTADQNTPADGYYGDTDELNDDLDLSFLDEAEKKPEDGAVPDADATEEPADDDDALTDRPVKL